MINRLTHYSKLLENSRSASTFKSLVGVVQISSGLDMDKNMEKIRHEVEQCAEQGAKFILFICLPENFNYMGRTYDDDIAMAQSINGQIIKKYRKLAQEFRVWLSLGGFQEACDQNPKKRYNTHLIINEEGYIVSEYRKLHLFDIDLTHKGGVSIDENRYIEPGRDVVDPIFSPLGYIGLSISNDLRYPELYRRLVVGGAQILLIPSAVFIKSGGSHWKSLLRARAIENQCYVISSNQVGVHHDKRQSHGNSMVVDPWGDIIGHMSDKEGSFVCEIDIDYLDRVRGNMACLTHIRSDLIF